ncbi:regulator of G-protein signaling loco isoform X4 [Hermetia illucens]|uniref:regulator of G-protein signaling loco isoform X4 n=1 Tax=Hermetia illucens TaxID=343691 RepID=UPI0018CC135B|nr:regulator of G-protein signaling loco isoform X4 [Hermetia illucens]
MSRNMLELVCGFYSEDNLESRAFPSTGTSPFRRWGQSSFRSARVPETRNSLARRPSSLAASENDVYTKSIDDYNHDLDSNRSQSEEIAQSSSQQNSHEGHGVVMWGQSFEKLLEDPAGLHTFAEFLKKEFSAENIYFWTACERYRQIASNEERAALAMDIFVKHLGNGALEPVNVDSQARNIAEENLKAADRNLFTPAQKQIFNLMKFDSYQRFIRSDLYKKCIEAEAKNQPLPYPAEQLDEVLITNLANMPGHTKLKKSASNAEDRRRKSILPWHRKARCKSRDRADSESQSNTKTPSSSKSSSGNTLKPHSTNSTSDIHSSRSSLSSFDAATAFAGGSDDLKTSLCRVILCNGATTIVQTRPNETIRQLVERLLEKRGIQYKFFDVLISGGIGKPLELDQPSTELAGKEVEIEQRVAFKLDLPDPKVISVKSKPKKALGDVLKPILQKYNYRIEEVQVLIRETHEPLTMDLPVTVADGLRLQVVLLNLEGWQQNHTQQLHQQQQSQQKRPSQVPTYQNSSNLQLPRVLPYPAKIIRPANQQVTLDEITNKVFNELLQGKAKAHAGQQQQPTSKVFDQNSEKSDDCASESSSIFDKIRRRESSSAGIKMARPKKIILPNKTSTAGSEDGLSTSTQTTTSSDPNATGIKKPLIAKWKTGVKLQVTGHRTEKHEEFLEGLKRAQRARLEDQRGTEINSELPDFLKNKENLNAINKLRKTNQLPNDSSTPQKQTEPVPSARSSLDSSVLPPLGDRPQPAPRYSITKSNTCASIFPTKSIDLNGNARSDAMNTSMTSSNGNNISPTRSSTSNDSNIDYESTESKAPPPPLPPKPKILPMKPSNWGQSPQSANSSPSKIQVIDNSVSAAARRHLNLDHQHSNSHNVYLDQPTSSFV